MCLPHVIGRLFKITLIFGVYAMPVNGALLGSAPVVATTRARSFRDRAPARHPVVDACRIVATWRPHKPERYGPAKQRWFASARSIQSQDFEGLVDAGAGESVTRAFLPAIPKHDKCYPPALLAPMHTGKTTESRAGMPALLKRRQTKLGQFLLGRYSLF